MDYPIIFSAPMVRALLDGRKTMTRRLKMQRRKTHPSNESHDWHEIESPWTRVKPGDRLWVRETLCSHNQFGFPLGQQPNHDMIGQRIWSYGADDIDVDSITNRRPSIHMPRWASRLTLIVTATKIERLQEITEEDAKAEGIATDIHDGMPKAWISGFAIPVGKGVDFHTISYEHEATAYFALLWEHLHGIRSWAANPEVVALSFRVVKSNIDRLPAEGA